MHRKHYLNLPSKQLNEIKSKDHDNINNIWARYPQNLGRWNLRKFLLYSEWITVIK